jgi:peroxiredoxin
MKTILAALALALAAPSFAALKIGEPAPAFTLTDQDGKTHSLADAKGKIVVLEWFNKDCPFVRKHYGAHHMQDLQKRYGGRGVVWYAVVSSAPGKEGFIDGPKAAAVMKDKDMGAAAILLDPKGEVGRAYSAKTTPHMFIVDAKGALAYMGGIDDKPTPDPADLKGAREYVAEALDALAAGKPVPTPVTNPYGCSVKY